MCVCHWRRCLQVKACPTAHTWGQKSVETHCEDLSERSGQVTHTHTSILPHMCVLKPTEIHLAGCGSLELSLTHYTAMDTNRHTLPVNTVMLHNDMCCILCITLLTVACWFRTWVHMLPLLSLPAVIIIMECGNNTMTRNTHTLYCKNKTIWHKGFILHKICGYCRSLYFLLTAESWNYSTSFFLL